MQLGKELYTIADYLHFLSHENITMFSSALLFQKFLMITFNFYYKKYVTKYLVIKDAIQNIKGFNTTISAHFKQEMFLS